MNMDNTIDGISLNDAAWERFFEVPDGSIDTEKWEEDLLFLEEEPVKPYRVRVIS